MKIIKIVITLLISTSTLMNCSGQTKQPKDDPSPAKKVPATTGNIAKIPVLLGNYLIDPVHKTVSREGYWERDEPNGIHAWGTDYTIDKDINFETTCLYIMDANIVFKEHYIQTQPTFVDEYGKPVDDSSYKHIANNFYEKDGTYYFLFDRRFRQLHKLTIGSGICIQDLTVAGQNFFYDDKGLYYVKEGNNSGLKLITVSEAKNCRPTVRATFCLYNGKAFTADLTALSHGPKIINADPAKLYEIDESRDCGHPFLTDGITVFKTYYNPEEKKVPGLSSWKQLSI